MTKRATFVPSLGDNGATIVYTDSYIYAIRQGCDGPIKVGRSSDPAATVRIQSLQIGNPTELFLLGVAKETDTLNERTEHRRLREHKIRGEWFNITPAHLPWLNAGPLVDLTPLQRPCPLCEGAGVAIDALNVGAAARRLGVTVRQVRQMIDDGEIAAGHIGPIRLVDPLEIDRITNAPPVP